LFGDKIACFIINCKGRRFLEMKNCSTESTVVLLLVVLVCIITSPSCFALNNGLALTPPMGWFPWERFRCNIDCRNDPDFCISEKLFMQIADSMVDNGFLAAGYEFVNLDDCWMAPKRDAQGNLQADPKRFPHGMPYLINYIHSKGLKFGIYEDYGNHTCEGYPGSYGYLERDAELFASWNVDMVKLDGCNIPVSDMNVGYPEMGRALNLTKRPMLYSCSWPDYERLAGMPIHWDSLISSCNMWRIFDDIQDSWSSVSSVIDFWSDPLLSFTAGPGHWNDPDALMVGDFSLSYDEAKAQFGMWAMWAAPLLMANDVRSLDPSFTAILLNKEVIAINQDPLGHQGTMVTASSSTSAVYTVWKKILANGTLAVALLNRSDYGEPQPITALWSELGLPTNSTAMVRDLFAQQNLGIFSGNFTTDVNPHGIVLVKVSPFFV